MLYEVHTHSLLHLKSRKSKKKLLIWEICANKNLLLYIEWWIVEKKVADESGEMETKRNETRRNNSTESHFNIN